MYLYIENRFNVPKSADMFPISESTIRIRSKHLWPSICQSYAGIIDKQLDSTIAEFRSKLWL